jgi:sugar transferase EpsL
MYANFIKRIFDFCFAACAITLLSPLLILIAILSRIYLKKPVMYNSIRAGKNGKPFPLYKFRSMTNEHGADGELLPDELRMTRYGALLRRLSLDELPQLFNVLRGDMSLIGPRPLPLSYLELYSDEQKKRLSVLPGLTGWTQIRYRADRTWTEKFAEDVYYVERQSFFLDAYIFGMTFVVLVKRFFVNKSAATTNDDFTGNN